MNYALQHLLRQMSNRQAGGVPQLLKANLNQADVDDAGSFPIEPDALPGTETGGYTWANPSAEIYGGGGGSPTPAPSPSPSPSPGGGINSFAGNLPASAWNVIDMSGTGAGGPAATANRPFINKVGTFFADRWLDNVPLGKLIDLIFDPRGRRDAGPAENALANFNQPSQQNPAGYESWQEDAASLDNDPPSFIMPLNEENIQDDPADPRVRYGRGHGPASHMQKSLWASAFPGSLLANALSTSPARGSGGTQYNSTTGAAIPGAPINWGWGAGPVNWMGQNKYL